MQSRVPNSHRILAPRIVIGSSDSERLCTKTNHKHPIPLKNQRDKRKEQKEKKNINVNQAMNYFSFQFDFEGRQMSGIPMMSYFAEPLALNRACR